MAKSKLTPEEFFTNCKVAHNNKYNYSNSVYTGSKNSLTYTCPNHGPRIQNANNHRLGSGCSDCSKLRGAQRRFLGTSRFIKLSKLKQRYQYDYSESAYKHSHESIKIICRKHGLFYQIASCHMRGSGCQKCYYESKMKPISSGNKNDEIKKIVFVPESRYKSSINHRRDARISKKCRDKKNFDFIIVKFYFGEECLYSDEYIIKSKN